MRPQVTETSREAWNDLKAKKLGERQKAVYNALKVARRPVTGREIENYLGLSGAWKRLPELERLGLAERAEPRKCRITGRSAQTWTPVI